MYFFVVLLMLAGSAAAFLKASEYKKQQRKDLFAVAIGLGILLGLPMVATGVLLIIFAINPPQEGD